MKNTLRSISGFAIVAFVLLSFSVSAEAQRRNDREVRDMLRTLNSRLDDFSYGFQSRLRSNSADPALQDEADANIRGLERAVSDFQVNFDNRRDSGDDINKIVTAAQPINSMLRSGYQSPRIRDDWQKVTQQIDRLANVYAITPRWDSSVSYEPIDNSNTSYEPIASNANGLSGIYVLDESRSDNAADIVNRLRVSGANRADLESKLRSQPQIAISIRGNEVTLATTDSPVTTFIADGSEMTDTDNGQNLRMRATLNGDELTISSVNNDTDYNIKFAVTDDGRSLKVTRRFTTGYLNETVFADSVYNKTNEVSALGVDVSNSSGDTGGVYSSNDPNDVYRPNGSNLPPTTSTGRTGQFVVPDGMIVLGTLETDIDTKASQNNDKFRMTVKSPSEFQGAVVEGYLSGIDRSGKISGRSNITFNFERITLRDGRTYDFAGSLYAIKDQDGKIIKIDSEGTAKGDSQTKETIKRGGIGAGLGALIGAIAGGAKGAAIGAIIGGGAGAGSVYVMGRDDLKLLKGSEISVQSSSPIRRMNDN